LVKQGNKQESNKMAQREKAEMERNWKLSATKALQVKCKPYLEQYPVYIREYYAILPILIMRDEFLKFY